LKSPTRGPSGMVTTREARKRLVRAIGASASKTRAAP
jgi:hypothetical protein